MRSAHDCGMVPDLFRASEVTWLEHDQSPRCSPRSPSRPASSAMPARAVSVCAGCPSPPTRSAARPGAIAAVIGVTAPTGSSDRRDAAGDRLDAHLQPGTGAWSGSAGVNAMLAARPGTFGASLIGRWNGTNAHGYRYGEALLY